MTEPTETSVQRISASSDSATMHHQEDTVEDNCGGSGKGLLTWEDRSAQFRRQLRPGSLEKLAAKLGVSAESLDRLGIGFDKHAYTFPMKSGIGEVVGIRTRPLKGGKLTMAGGHPGLFVPEAVTPGNLRAICEGESDTAAALTMGVQAIGIPGAGSVVAEVCRYVSQAAVTTPCIVGDNDSAGGSSVESVKAALLAVDIPCKVLFPPPKYKDLRQWAAECNLSCEEFLAAVDRQPVLYPADWPQGYFQCPNSFARQGLIKRIGVGPFALACLLASFQGWDKKAFPTRERLARELQRSVSTIDRYKKILRREGMLTWKRGHKNRCNEYRVSFGPVNGSKTAG